MKKSLAANAAIRARNGVPRQSGRPDEKRRGDPFPRDMKSDMKNRRLPPRVSPGAVK
jgi:hypothetical protein